MIFDAQSYSLIFQDAIYALAIGFVTGFFNQLLAVFLYKGKLKILIRDIVISSLFTVLIFSYSVSFANYRILRWYNVMFALIGAMLYMPCFSAAGNLLLKMAGITIKFAAHKAALSTGKKIHDIRQKNIEKKQKFTPESTQKVLKTDDIMLYN